MLTAVSDGAAQPGDLCRVLSYPAVECCVVIEQRAQHRSLSAIWIDSCLPPWPGPPGWTGSALCTTPLGVEERDGLCSHRWRTGPRSAPLSCLPRRRPHGATGCPIPSGRRLPATAGWQRYRQKNPSYTQRLTALPPRPAAAPRRWCALRSRSRSNARVRQKNCRTARAIPGCAGAAGRPDRPAGMARGT